MSWQGHLKRVLDLDELVGTAQELIRCSSVNPPGDEEAVARVSARCLRQAGARDITTITASKGRDSVIARWGKLGSRVLAWNGHTDVVPTADETQWRHPPFSALVADGRLWGRGATDMKGSIACVLQAFSMIARAGLELQGEIAISLVGDEECGGLLGSGYLYEHGMLPRADAGICGEPTGLDVVTTAQGRLWIEVTTFGTSAHASQAELGDNAIKGMEKVLQAFEKQELVSESPAAGRHVVLTPTVIRGGDSPNSIPDCCTLTIDCRFLPSEGAKFAREQIAHAVNGVRRDEGIRIEVAERACLDASEIDPNSEIVCIVQEAVRIVSGRQSRVGMMRGATDARFLIAAGVPTVIVGPGNLGDAHSVDESVLLDDLVQGALVYAITMCSFLGVC